MRVADLGGSSLVACWFDPHVCKGRRLVGLHGWLVCIFFDMVEEIIAACQTTLSGYVFWPVLWSLSSRP
jgi:hypothetical protein